MLDIETPIVPSDLLESWKNEDKRLEAQERAIREKRAMLRKLIDAGTSLSSVAHDANFTETGSTSNPEPDKAVYGTWPDTIVQIVQSADRGFAHSEVKAGIMETPLAAKLRESDNSYYGAVKTLVDQKRLHRIGGLLYSQKAFDQQQKAVENEQKEEVAHNHPPSMPNAILAFLENLPSGKESGDINSELRGNPVFSERIKNNPNAVYSALSEMSKKEKLRKKGTLYVHPKYF